MGKGKRSTVVATQGKSVKDNLVAVFGAKQAATLMPFKQADGEVCENASLRSSIEYNLKTILCGLCTPWLHCQLRAF